MRCSIKGRDALEHWTVTSDPLCHIDMATLAFIISIWDVTASSCTNHTHDSVVVVCSSRKIKRKYSHTLWANVQNLFNPFFLFSFWNFDHMDAEFQMWSWFTSVWFIFKRSETLIIFTFKMAFALLTLLSTVVGVTLCYPAAFEDLGANGSKCLFSPWLPWV